MQHPENVPCSTDAYFMSYIDLTGNGNGKLTQLRTALRILYSYEAKDRLIKLLDEYSFDVVHLHNIHHQISPSILHVLKKRKIPVVMTLHDYKMACASYSMLANEKPCEACSGGRYFEAVKKSCVKGSRAKSVLAAIEMYLHHRILDIYNNVDIFISPSLFLKNKLQDMGFRKQIVHLPNFVDALYLGQVKVNDSDNSLVYFGRLSQEKGLWTLLKAVKLLSDNRSLKMKIIGDGSLKCELEEMTKKEGMRNVQFLGYMKGEALLKEIKKSIGVIIPSECYENNPMSVIEAFALGKPVIGARIGGIPELVKDNETGLTFEPGNAEDLAEKMKILSSNEPFRVQIGINAREFVERELNPEKHYQKLMEIYDGAVESCRGRYVVCS